MILNHPISIPISMCCAETGPLPVYAIAISFVLCDGPALLVRSRGHEGLGGCCGRFPQTWKVEVLE